MADHDGSTTLGGFQIDDTGITVPQGFTDAVNLLIDGQRVWSFTPGESGNDQSRAGWPAALKSRLSGQADMQLQRIIDGEVVFAESVRLGSGDGRITVVDKDGNPLSIDKGGRLSKMFDSAAQENKLALIERVKEALGVLADLDVEAFLAFGCLLGAVREGKLIGHDSDADVAYLASSTHPFDIIRESMHLEHQFNERGWRTRRMSGADFKVFASMPDGSQVGIDIFGSFYRGDTFYLMPSVAGKLPVSSLLPQSTVELEGVAIPAPADPEALLEVTYGPNWRVPDPSFKFTPSRATTRFLGGLMRGERKHHAYWDQFYKHKADGVPQDPSSFAQWVAEREPDRGGLIDIGSGTGRDSLWLSSQGFETLGCDYSMAGVMYASRLAKKRGLSAQFEQLNLYDVRHVLTKGARYARERQTDIVYARFLIHAMEDNGRELLWVLSRSALRASKGRLYIEWRTEATKHEFGEHYRQFVQPDVVQAELEHHGFEIEHCENRFGLAVHKSEDPRVCRIVAKMR